MKIFKLFPLACAALMMSACGSDNDIEGGATNPAGDAQYLAVNIVNVGTTPTGRAAVSGYEDGTAEESKIKTIRFYFFHADGSAYTLEGLTPGSVENYLEKTISASDVNDNDGTNTVEKITKAILVINGTTKKAPASVIAVVNPESITPALGTGTKNLNELSKTLTGSQFYNVTSKDQFVMTNSVYVEAGRTVCPVSVAGHIGTDASTAEANAVNIYAERVVAKVDAKLQGGSLVANAAGTTKYGMQVGTYGASTKIYAVIDGWGVADENDNAYVEKQIDNTWLADDLGIDPWSTNNYHRSFWGTSPAFSAGTPINHKFADYKAQHNDVLYTLPNTQTTAVSTANVYNNDLTKFLVTATLRYEDGTGAWHNAEICKYQGVEYLGIDALKEAIATTFNMYYTEAGGVYTPIQAADVDFTTTGTGLKDYQVSPVLKTGKTYYKKNPTGTGYTALTATDNINKFPAEVRKEGKAYYFIPIRHIATNAAKVGYYGVVRNHWYQITLNSLTGYGTPVYDDKKIIDPTMPEDQATYLAAKINVLQWRVVPQEVNLGK